jgi:ketosteroid isomerase-like protein
MDNDLEARIKRLEDIEAIKQEKSRYVYCLDVRDWDGVLEHFTDDAIVDFGELGHHEGREEMVKYFKEDFPPLISFTLHMTQDPIIEVSGDTARGRWYMHESLTFAATNRASWGAARYDDELVRVNGKWKVRRCNITIFYLSPFDEGWVKNRMYLGED